VPAARLPARARPWALAALAGLVVAVVLASLAIGARAVPVADVVAALTGWGPAPDHTDEVVIRTLRLPRTVLGLVVGAALGVAGALVQALTRNPLADPGILGVNAGAALMVVLALTVLGWSGTAATAGAGMIGALLAVLVVLGLAAGRSVSPLRLILAGTAFAAAISGVTSALVLVDAGTLDQVRFWSIGSISGRDDALVWPAIAVVGVAVLVGLALAGPLDTLGLGDEMATSLGTAVVRTRLALLLTVSLLCGTATAVAGPIGFVGLAVPLLARTLGGGDARWLLLFSAVLGALLLLGADVAGRLLARPAEIEVGVVVALVGAPLFVLVARRHRLVRL